MGSLSDLTAVSLFAGIGGIDEALRRAGVRVVAAVEIDEACRGVLARHFPETVLFNDVTEVTGDQLRAAGFVPGRGILAGGWPCTGNSVAGGREGLADPRSGLWMHFARLLAELRPAWFLGENVPGLYSVNGGADIAVVRGDIAQRGYWWAERILDAQYFGVPQRRRRVFFAGCAGDPQGPVEVLLEPEGCEWDLAARGTARAHTAPASPSSTGSARTVGTIATTSPGGGWRVGADEATAGQLVIAPALTAGMGTNHAAPGDGGKDQLALATMAATLQGGGRRGHRIDAEGAAGNHLVAYALSTAQGRNDREQTYVTHALTSEGADASEDGTGRSTPIVPIGVPLTSDDTPVVAARRLTPRECERLQGFPDDWTRWLADGTEQSDSARYRQCGNAVAVPVCEWIAHRLVAVDAATGESEAVA